MPREEKNWLGFVTGVNLHDFSYQLGWDFPRAGAKNTLEELD